MSSDLYQQRVRQVMSKVVVTASPADNIHDVLVLMEENSVSTLPVVDPKRHCVGIFSASDLVHIARELDDEINDTHVSRTRLIKRLREHDLGHQQIGERMTATVAGISPEETLVHAASEMLRHRVHHLPVLDEQQHLLGIVSTMDILTAFVENATHNA